MIQITNLTKRKIDEKFLIGLAKKVLKEENREKDNLSIVFVNKKRIWELNKKYRKKDKPTDVLSFGDELNEIVICPAIVKTPACRQAGKKELERVLIHGILHLFGYEHSKKMRAKEKLWQNNT
ncbi:rRNA maturation RNase YbeY [Patescibacteria group bacterium]|nr:rRNA maturation RNase YbeY [Patescibacteria group bacterium]